MDKEIKLHGIWFLPTKSETEYSGTFVYTRNEGCYLEIIGGFEDIFKSSESHGEYEIILGVTVEGKEITLVSCSRNFQKRNSNGVAVSKYSADYAFIGNHFDNVDSISFDTLRASICDIEDWIGIYGFNKLDITFGEFKIDLQYQLPKKCSFIVTDDQSVTFEFECTFPIYRNTVNAVIKQSTFIGLSSVKELPFMQMLNSFFRLYKFISIAYYDSPHVQVVHLYNSTKQNNKSKHKEFVEVLYSDNFFNETYKKGQRLHKFLFTYEDMKVDFPIIIKAWFNIYEKISPAVNLLVELLLEREYALELQFLSAIQAVETFHRNVFGGEDLPEPEHKERIRSIIENIPGQYKAWLKERLAFSNELTLRKRLSDIYNRIPPEISETLIKNPKVFIDCVVASRNYYTHYNKSLKKKVMSSFEIVKAVEKLKVLLICSILNEVHFSKDQIIKFVKLEKVYRYDD